ncbi:hypothetical protein M0805_003750 [Coniferiporia weirii]|nr:hypothetical protein M0805_003750 [Coniferiporia weirii]
MNSLRFLTSATALRSLKRTVNSQKTRPMSSYSRDENARWGRLGETMEQFHNYFKMEFGRVYELSDGSFVNYRMSLQMFLREAEGLKKHLEAHHSIEERFIFPELAKKMPAFAADEQHRKSHEAIHEGLDKLSALTREFRENPTSYSPERMRECLESFREVLMRHLDEEVADLSAENMKKYWTLEEVDRIPM